MHNTLAASEYALLEQDTNEPRPNYWAALLWNRLMGTKVYDAGVIIPGVDIFAHCLKNSSKGIAVLIVNYLDSEYSINIPSEAEQYMLTAEELQTNEVKLNGVELELTTEFDLPDISGKKINAGKVQLPPHSILFLSFKNN